MFGYYIAGICAFSLLVSSLFSCAPKISTNVDNPQPVLADSNIVVLKETDSFVNPGIEVGNVHAGDNGFSTNCSYDEVMKILKEKARKNGANIIKITEYIPPDSRKSTCDRIRAKLYRVDTPERFEKEIEWAVGRKLKWSDFKGSFDSSGTTSKRIAAATSCGINIRTNYVTIFSKVKTFVSASFNCESSWVKTAGLNNEALLLHEQTHFDLAEVYARRLRKELSERRLTVSKFLQELNDAFFVARREYNRRQSRFDEETDHGTKTAMEKQWEKTVAEELSATSAFAQ